MRFVPVKQPWNKCPVCGKDPNVGQVTTFYPATEEIRPPWILRIFGVKGLPARPPRLAVMCIACMFREEIPLEDVMAKERP